MLRALSPCLAYATASYKRQFAYRVANWAGLFSNAFFLFFRVGVLTACYHGRGETAGLTMEQAVTYAAFTQALLMVVPFWGKVGVSEAVRSGQIAMELSRPVSYLGMVLSRRMGLSAYHLLVRCLPLLALGAAVGALAAPASPGNTPLLAASLFMGAIVAHLFLFLVEVSSFWLETDRGARAAGYGLMAIFGGLLMPLAFFPDSLQPLLKLLPFRSALHLPAEIYIGTCTGLDLFAGLAIQAFWVVALFLLAQALLHLGERKLVIHGG